jgi:hypothetical protein
MTVDGSDNVHVVWIKDVDVNQPTSDIYYSKSPPPVPGPCNPTGLDFTGLSPGSVAPKTVNDNPWLPPACPPKPARSTDFANAPTVAVAVDGTIYVAWIDVNVLISSAQPEGERRHNDERPDPSGHGGEARRDDRHRLVRQEALRE